MSEPEVEVPTVLEEVPSLLHAFDYGEWAYYVSGHDEDGLLAIDEPDVLEWEKLWMHPIAASALDESERPDDFEALTRDDEGRFKSVMTWMECPESAQGAQPFLGVKYRPV